MRTEHEIEPWFPGLPTIRGSHSYLANSPVDAFPRATYQSLLASNLFGPGKNHFISCHLSLDHQQPSAIGYPALVPDVSGGVVDVEALAFHPVGILVIFAKDTTTEQALHSRARDRC